MADELSCGLMWGVCVVCGQRHRRSYLHDHRRLHQVRRRALNHAVDRLPLRLFVVVGVVEWALVAVVVVRRSRGAYMVWYVCVVRGLLTWLRAAGISDRMLGCAFP